MGTWLAVVAVTACAGAGIRGGTPEDAGPSSPEPEAPEDNADDVWVKPPRCAGPPFPIVLAHGFTGFDRIGSLHYFYRVADDLRVAGETVVEAEVAPYQSTSVRALQLAAFVDALLTETGKCQVVIIAHSQGGLDARHLTFGLGYIDRIAAIVTIGTPHKGTRVADAILGLQPGWSEDLVDALAALLGTSFSDVADDPDVRASLESIAEANADAFAQANPDDPRVGRFSIAGRSLEMRGDDACAPSVWPNPVAVDRVDPSLWVTANFLAGNPREVSNDGLVTVASARWGTFLGCIPADHMDEVGQVADDGPNAGSGWSHRTFYRDLVELLRTKGY